MSVGFREQTCLSSNLLKTAGSYLLVLHNLEQLDESNSDGIRLLRRAIAAKDWTLCKELLRFFRSIDDTGNALKTAMKGANLVEDDEGVVGVVDSGLGRLSL